MPGEDLDWREMVNDDAMPLGFQQGAELPACACTCDPGPEGQHQWYCGYDTEAEGGGWAVLKHGKVIQVIHGEGAEDLARALGDGVTGHSVEWVPE